MKIIKTLAVLFAGFLGGVICASWCLWPTFSAVKVRIQNESGFLASTIRIIHEGGSVTIDNLNNGESKIVPVHVVGESSYSVVATLEGGEVVVGEGGYIEPGYRIRETITQNKIQHKFESFY